jgi:hypothetical protein
MQVIAIVALTVIFILNYLINIEFVDMLGSFSPYVAGQRPEVAWIFALMLALFISIFPSLEKEFRVTVLLGVIIIIILFFLGGPAIAYFATYDIVAVGTALANSLIEFLKILTVLLYWSPILFGVYGIFIRDKMYIFISLLLLIGIIISTDLYLLSMNLSHTKSEAKIPLFTIFALALFCFYEMSDSSITFFQLNDVEQTRVHQSAHQDHLNRILQNYFVFFILFSALALVLAGFILNFNDVLKAVGSEQIAASIELNSIYGTMVSLVVMMIILIIAGYIIRYEMKLRKTLDLTYRNIKRLLPTRTENQYDKGVNELSEKPLPPPPPPSTSSPPSYVPPY